MGDRANPVLPPPGEDGPEPPAGNTPLNAVYYGRPFTDAWEADLGHRPGTPAAVDFLHRLAAGRPVLEFGIGTGRLSLPLAARGLRVSGIEYSPWMAGKLRQAPGGQDIEVAIGDFTTTTVERRFGLVFLASFTLFALRGQDEQLACFRNAYAHLEPGGAFLLELPTTDSGIYTGGRSPMSIGHGWYETEGPGDNVWLLLRDVSPERQHAATCYVDLRSGAMPRLRPSDGRYASPGEVDLMAADAGFLPGERLGGWDGSAYRAQALSYIVVYLKP